MNNRTLFKILFVLTLPLSAVAESVVVYPNDSKITARLGISEIDLKEIKLLTNKESGHYIVKIEKSPTGFIGVWMAPLPKVKNPSGGPVFFYNKHQGKWYKLSEMSVWGDHL